MFWYIPTNVIFGADFWELGRYPLGMYQNSLQFSFQGSEFSVDFFSFFMLLYCACFCSCFYFTTSPSFPPPSPSPTSRPPPSAPPSAPPSPLAFWCSSCLFAFGFPLLLLVLLVYPRFCVLLPLLPIFSGWLHFVWPRICFNLSCPINACNAAVDDTCSSLNVNSVTACLFFLVPIEKVCANNPIPYLTWKSLSECMLLAPSLRPNRSFEWRPGPQWRRGCSGQTYIECNTHSCSRIGNGFDCDVQTDKLRDPIDGKGKHWGVQIRCCLDELTMLWSPSAFKSGLSTRSVAASAALLR